MSTTKVAAPFRFMYVRDRLRNPVGCLAFSYEKGSDEVRFNFSSVNPKDDLDKKVGRQLALGRLIEDPFLVKGKVLTSTHETALSMMNYVLEHRKSFPQAVVDFARRWKNESMKKQKNLDKGNKTLVAG